MTRVFLAGLACFLSPSLHAQPLVTIDLVTVGDAGDSMDNTGYGAVTNVFVIGQYGESLSQGATGLPLSFFPLTDSHEKAMLEALGEHMLCVGFDKKYINCREVMDQKEADSQKNVYLSYQFTGKWMGHAWEDAGFPKGNHRLNMKSPYSNQGRSYL